MSTRKFIKKLTASLLFIAVVMSFGVQSAFAESNSPKATVKNNVVTFSNLDQLKANEKLAIAVVDSNGDPATITIESVDNSISRVAKSSNSWKVSYKGVVIHAYFYMTVTNNKVTNAWDYSITTLGSTYSDANAGFRAEISHRPACLPFRAGIVHEVSGWPHDERDSGLAE